MYICDMRSLYLYINIDVYNCYECLGRYLHIFYNLILDISVARLYCAMNYRCRVRISNS